ncbi:integrase [Kitasatospora gansuensis]|uniref:Integrase n=1 Tax=Kitasatospora gansuensis TaxID=258050 RepID=A0A7W7WHL4_9ACTN|nr:site-specific integrase [Kitasatospora gansuensis]MBB4947862.1 integrase [Kitasatospora gansuensis]
MTKRNPNGAGSVSRRKDGSYEARVYVTTTDGERKRISRYGKTYDEAAEKLAKAKELEDKGVPTPSKAWKTDQWLDYWLDQVIKPNRGFGTYDKHETMVRLYLKPGLGKGALTKLNVRGVRAFFNKLERDEVGGATRQEVMKTLRAALTQAMKEELLLRNVARLVDMPKASRKEVIPWTAQDALTFLRSARPHRLHAAFVFALVLGFRRGELLGLRWIDVDLSTGTIHPRKQVRRRTGVGLVHVDLKTEASTGAVPLPRFCLEALGERRVLQQREKVRAGIDWTDMDLIFSTETGGMVDPDGFSETFERRVLRSGVRRVPLKVTRHTVGSLLAHLGVHPNDAQKILRHARIQTTLEIYTHVTTATQRAAAAKLSDTLRQGISSAPVLPSSRRPPQALA